jgi:hypothetical protein
MFCIARRFGVVVLVAAIGVISASGAHSAGPATNPVQSTITVDAYWLRLTPTQIPAGHETLAASLLNDPKVLYARARAVGFEGQEVTMAVADSVDVVSGSTPVVAPGVSIYQPTTTSMKFGVELVETPGDFDGSSLEISFDSTVKMRPQPTTDTPKPRPTTDPLNPPNPMVINSAGEVVGSASAELHAKSTLRLPIGVPTIVSGMSDHPGAADDRTLCLVLCANKS